MRIWHVSVLLAAVAMFSVGQSAWAQATKPAGGAPVVVKDDARESAGADTAREPAVDAARKVEPTSGFVDMRFIIISIIIIMVAVTALLLRRFAGMNKIQQILALVGLIVVLCMFLVPPWVQVPRAGPEWGNASRGYHWIFEPPGPFDISYFAIRDEVRINTVRLAAQFGIAGFLFGGLVFIFRDRNRSASK